MSRHAYERLAEAEELPLYAQSAWLETVGGATSLSYLVAYQDELPLALVPYYRPSKGIWITPPLCQNGGIYFAKHLRAERALEHKAFVLRRKVVEAVLKTVGEHRYSKIALSADFRDALPFYWRGFNLNLRYNYLLALPLDPNTLLGLGNMDMRQKVKRAEKANAFFESELLFTNAEALFARHHRRKGVPRLYFEALKRAVGNMLPKRKGFLAGVYSSHKKLLAASFVTIEGSRAYLIASAAEELHKSEAFANAYLLHCSISEAIRRGATIFDFEGSMLPGVEPTFRSFGAVQEPFIEVSNGKLRLLDRLALRQHYLGLQKPK